MRPPPRATAQGPLRLRGCPQSESTGGTPTVGASGPVDPTRPDCRPGIPAPTLDRCGSGLRRSRPDRGFRTTRHATVFPRSIRPHYVMPFSLRRCPSRRPSVRRTSVRPRRYLKVTPCGASPIPPALPLSGSGGRSARPVAHRRARRPHSRRSTQSRPARALRPRATRQ